MIRESIVTTLGADGSPHIAPIGVIVEPEGLVATIEIAQLAALEADRADGQPRMSLIEDVEIQQ